MAAMILEAQGKQDEARRRYERLVEANPRAAVASNNLAWMYASRGEQLDRALQLAQAAKAELPDVPAVNDTLAYVYIKKQLGSLAVPLLKQAIAKQAADKQPEDPLLHHLGLAYAQTGDKAAARQALEHALKLKADFEGADEARALLKASVTPGLQARVQKRAGLLRPFRVLRERFATNYALNFRRRAPMPTSAPPSSISVAPPSGTDRRGDGGVMKRPPPVLAPGMRIREPDLGRSRSSRAGVPSVRSVLPCFART